MPFQCPKCGKFFKTEKTIRKHMERKIPCDRKFICQKCNKEFKTKQNYNTHINRKTSCKPIQGDPTKQADNPNKTCMYCYKKFVNTQNRNRHYNVCKIKNGGMSMLFDTIMENQKKEIVKLKEEQNRELDKLKKENNKKLNDLMKEINILKNNKIQPMEPMEGVVNNNITNNITNNNTVNLNVTLLGNSTTEGNYKITEHFRGKGLKIIDGPLEENAKNLQIIDKIDIIIKNSHF